MPYKCPKCGKVYEVPPKWCPCEPYPSPEDVYLLVDGSSGDELKLTEEQYKRFFKILDEKGLVKNVGEDPFYDVRYERTDDLKGTGYELVVIFDRTTPGCAVHEDSFPRAPIPLTSDEYQEFVALLAR